MSIAGINDTRTGIYPQAGGAQKTAVEGVNFLGQLQKMAEKPQDKEMDAAEKAFAMVGENAPQEVKDAWMEAAKEVKANGLGMRENGMMSHISQMMVQRLQKSLRGEAVCTDILGNTVQSAIRATKHALYDLEHPIAQTPKSIAVQQAKMKEREFYLAFIEKLEKI